MTVLSVPLDQNLYQRAEDVAAKQGSSIVGFVSDALKHYLESYPTWSYTIERDEETNDFVVSDSVVHAYGTGETVDEALVDYRLMLMDMYEELSENAHRLSPRLERQYKALCHYVREEGR